MRLSATWAEHRIEGILLALTKMMDLVAWLTKEISNAYPLKEPPVAPEAAARRWVTEISTPPPPREPHSKPREG